MCFVCYLRFTYMKLSFYINFVGLVFRLYFRWLYAFLSLWVQMDPRLVGLEDFRVRQTFVGFLVVMWVIIGIGLGWEPVSAFDLSNAQVTETLASTFVCPTKLGFYCGLFRLEEQTSQLYLWFFV